MSASSDTSCSPLAITASSASFAASSAASSSGLITSSFISPIKISAVCSEVSFGCKNSAIAFCPSLIAFMTCSSISIMLSNWRNISAWSWWPSSMISMCVSFGCLGTKDGGCLETTFFFNFFFFLKIIFCSNFNFPLKPISKHSRTFINFNSSSSNIVVRMSSNDMELRPWVSVHSQEQDKISVAKYDKTPIIYRTQDALTWILPLPPLPPLPLFRAGSGGSSSEEFVSSSSIACIICCDVMFLLSLAIFSYSSILFAILFVLIFLEGGVTGVTNAVAVLVDDVVTGRRCLTLTLGTSVSLYPAALLNSVVGTTWMLNVFALVLLSGLPALKIWHFTHFPFHSPLRMTTSAMDDSETTVLVDDVVAFLFSSFLCCTTAQI